MLVREETGEETMLDQQQPPGFSGVIEYGRVLPMSDKAKKKQPYITLVENVTF